MYRRAAALDIGGYDRGYAPVSLDDLDLTVSLRRSGLNPGLPRLERLAYGPLGAT